MSLETCIYLPSERFYEPSRTSGGELNTLKSRFAHSISRWKEAQHVASLMGGRAPGRENDETTQSTVYVFFKNIVVEMKNFKD